jgi:anti-sigma28 factor (negative regulator of flagellin synthesis)
VARAVRANVGAFRTARVAQIEKAIDSGTYQPSASEVASQLLDAAEIDASLQGI